MKKIKIGKRVISGKSRPYVIAEVGVNYYDIAKKEHISPLAAAKRMIDAAAKAGADAIKFQTYKAHKLASKYSPAYWDTTKEKTKSQLELFKKFDKFGRVEYRALAAHAKKKKIHFLSTPFDLEAVDMLEPLVPAFKIASADITNHPLIERAAMTGKPIIFSTGASTLDEVKAALRVIYSTGNRCAVPLHCTLNYPTENSNANLGSITYLQKNLPDMLVGYSDHTLPDERMVVLTSSVLLGARVIEKHFTFDKTIPGNDHYHAMDVNDLMVFINNLDLLDEIMGEEKLTVLPSEKISRKFARRSLVAGRDIKKGETISRGMLEIKRPGTGIPPTDIKKILGKKATRNIEADEILKKGYFK